MYRNNSGNSYSGGDGNDGFRGGGRGRSHSHGYNRSRPYNRGGGNNAGGPYNNDGSYKSDGAYKNDAPSHRNEMETGQTQSEGGRKHPPGLKGKEIGLWYARNKRGGRGRAAPKHVPSVNMDSNEARHIDRVLDSLDQPSNNMNADYKGAQAGTSYTRTIDAMRDTSFKREYMANVQANHSREEEKQMHIKPELVGLSRNEALDANLLEDFLQQQNSEKYKKMLVSRQRLPSYTHKQKIVDLVQNNQVVVLSGETGCGKTTQVPQFLLEAAVLGGRGSMCHVVCTQPRRISAITVAQRVAEERGEALGRSVGYQIRLESKCSRACGSIMYCTTGIVLQFLQGDPLLNSVSHLVLDEIHERDMQSDFLIAITRDLLPKRPDLKLILMSATLNAEKFSQYYGHCPMIHIPGFTFHVAEFYLEDVIDHTRFEFMKPKRKHPLTKKEEEFFQQSILPWVNESARKGMFSAFTAQQLRQPHSELLSPELIVRLLDYISSQAPGAVLVFLPGWGDISEVHKQIQAHPRLGTKSHLVIPLHSLMPTTNQREVFNKPPPGVRKIVLATNIAETSITIDDIVYVVDGGYIKMRNFDKSANLDTLQSEWVTLANAHQRRGRAGRVQVGVCYHLYTRRRESTLANYPIPEILRTRLEEIILHVKILRLGKVKAFLDKLMQGPDEDVVVMSIKLLEAINALDEDENLTPLGFHLAKLPIDPLTGRMLLMAAIFSCVDPILTIAATLSFKDPFVVPLGKEQMVDAIKVNLAGNTRSDHLMFVKAYDAWRQATENGDNTFCWKNFMSPSVLSQLKTMRNQFFRLLKDHKFVSESVNSSSAFSVNRNSGNIAVVRAVLTAGLYPNVARLRMPKNKRSKAPLMFSTAHDTHLALHPKCVIDKIREFDTPWIVFREKMKLSQVSLFDASSVPNYPLLLFGQKLNYNHAEKLIDVDGFVKVKCSQQIADVIRKLRQELDSLLEYKISHPSVTQWNQNTNEGKLLQAIVDLLTNEKMSIIEEKSQDNNRDNAVGSKHK